MLVDEVNVNVLAADVFGGLNATVSPAGRPEAVMVMLPLKPLTGFTVIVVDKPEPARSAALLGELEMVKLGVGIVS